MSSSTKPGFLEGAVCGGIGAMFASTITHPLDLFKVRLQLRGELESSRVGASAPTRLGIIPTFKHMLRTEGVSGFYSGLSASLLRQALYSPARFGLFQWMMEKRALAIFSKQQQNKPSTAERFFASLLSGGIGGTLSSPADLILVRMQADGRLSGTNSQHQRKYTNVFSGLWRVTKEEGVLSLWRGSLPNIQRAMIVTCCQFTSYDLFKTICSEQLHMKQDSIQQHFVAAMMSGVVVAVCASPVDVMRTRMMNSRKAVRATVQQSSNPAVSALSPSSSPSYARAYTSTLDCMLSTLRTEGPLGFYKGFFAYYIRVAPQVTLMFVAYEEVRKVWRKFD